MRAVAVSRFRVPPEMMDLPAPTVGPGELLVRVAFAGINPFDGKIADGILEGHRPHRFPLVLGVDASGTVDAVGPGVQRFRVGDRVFGEFLHDPVGTGTYEELSPVPESVAIVRAPDELPLAEAAALPMAGMTALESLDALALTPGATLVIVGASGGVGSFATELAAAQGIRVVAVARATSSARLRSLGAEEVVDPTAGDPLSRLGRDHPAQVDGLLDVSSDGPTFVRYARAVRRGGRAVSTTFSADVAMLETAGIHAVNLNLQPTAKVLERLVREMLDRRLKVPLERRVPLGEAPVVLAELKAGRGRGKTVIDLGA